MRTRLFIQATVIFILLASGTLFGQNTISFDNLQVYPERIISVDVSLANSDTIEGMQLPISFRGSRAIVTCDSVSFAGGRCDAFDFKQPEIFDNKKAVFVGLVSNTDVDFNNSPLLPGSGTICKLFFSLPDSLERTDFRLGKARIRHGRRDFSFMIWTPTARKVHGNVVPFNCRLPR